MRRLSSSAVPSATIRPWSRTAIRSASSSASSRYCVVRRIVTPPAASPRMASHIVRRLRGSRPVVGSSRKITRGEPTKVMARSSRRRIPPEYVDAGRRAASTSSNRSSSSATRRRPASRPSRLRSAISCRFSSPVSRSSSAENWPVTPIAARTPSGSARRSWPATRSSPASAGSSVVRIRTIVVLPAPFGPSSAKIVPSSTVTSTWSSTRFSPNDLRTPVAMIAGVMPGPFGPAARAAFRRRPARPGAVATPAASG